VRPFGRPRPVSAALEPRELRRRFDLHANTMLQLAVAVLVPAAFLGVALFERALELPAGRTLSDQAPRSTASSAARFSSATGDAPAMALNPALLALLLLAGAAGKNASPRCSLLTSLVY
jgi:hypothetical protein